LSGWFVSRIGQTSKLDAIIAQHRSFHALKELITAIEDYIENHNQKPQVFVWSAPVERILSKIAKCNEALDAVR
jgi:hypothetical protein